MQTTGNRQWAIDNKQWTMFKTKAQNTKTKKQERQGNNRQLITNKWKKANGKRNVIDDLVLWHCVCTRLLQKQKGAERKRLFVLFTMH